jgi:voltage-gated potassium channel Kch
MAKLSKELRNTNYELFILAISILALINMGLTWLWRGQPAAGVVSTMDAVLTVFFLSDFLLRLLTAESKFRYFFIRFGWADLLGSLWLPGLPVLRLFRLFRVVRVIRLIRRQYGLRNLVRTYRKERANAVLGTMTFLILLVLEFGGIAVLTLESASPNANIQTPGDALWWGVVTIATVGYGDRYPVTEGGRLVGVLTIISGVGLFGVITGFLANAFLSPRRKQEEPAQPGPTEPEAMLAEVRRLAAEQDAHSAHLQARLERIEALLAKEAASSLPGSEA